MDPDRERSGRVLDSGPRVQASPASLNMDPDQTATLVFIVFVSMMKYSLKCTCKYAAEVKSSQYFQDKNYFGRIRVNRRPWFILTHRIHIAKTMCTSVDSLSCFDKHFWED